VTPYALSLLALAAFILSFPALLTDGVVRWAELVIVAGLLVDRAQA
jgi:hypothetical protein